MFPVSLASISAFVMSLFFCASLGACIEAICACIFEFLGSAPKEDNVGYAGSVMFPLE